MEALIKRKSILKGQITKLTNFALSCNDSTSYDVMKARLDKINDHYKSFVSIEDEIFVLDADIESDIDTVDENYFSCVTKLQGLMRSKIQTPRSNLNETILNASSSSNSGFSADFKLPRLSLPTFSGKAREWQSFYDLFRSTVHENTSLSPAQKFQYLLGQLKGPAETLVRHFRVDDASYIEAFQKLVKRYDRKRSIVHEFIESFIRQSHISKPSSDSIGSLYDTCDEVIRGLKALGARAETRDCWLVYLAEKKLDEVTLQLWRQESTKLGWIIGGTLPSVDALPHPTTCLAVQEELSVDQTLRKFWQTEEIPVANRHTEDEQRCIDNFNEHMSVDPISGKFTVTLPFKTNSTQLGDSLNQALRRFNSLEQKLLRCPDLRENYQKFIAEYESLGHMELVPPDQIDLPNEKRFYLPHHPVIKTSSSTTKLRVVFDASAKSASGVSLNDLLIVGPTIQQTLFEILLRFRKHKFIITADIEKMFRQVWIAKADTDYQRIVWRDSPAEPIRHYRLLTNTYGTASASFIATQALSQLAQLHQESHPKAAKILLTDFYMDDLMTGADSIEETISIQREVDSLLTLGGYHLRKWATNDSRLLEDIPESDREISVREISEGTKLISILGVIFDPLADSFSIKVSLPSTSKMTKRSMLSESSRVFDPLGWISPVTVGVKILYQGLWLQKLDWEDELPSDIGAKWADLRCKLTVLENLQIPRWLNSTKSVQLCGFADASKVAYAAVIYARTISSSGEVQTNIIAAKTKVAPIKYTSTARLELCAALLLIRLVTVTIKSLNFATAPKIALWSDSTTVLAWMANPPMKGDIFVLNRVTEILNSSNVQQWSYVPTRHNPADCASRGISPEDLMNNSLWWQGPEWLQREPIRTPAPPKRQKMHVPEKSTTLISFPTKNPQAEGSAIIARILDRCSSLPKAVRVFAWILRLKFNLQNPMIKNETSKLSLSEVHESYIRIIKDSQFASFSNEIEDLRKNVNLKKSNAISFLYPFIDKSGLLRVGGRLQNAMEGYDLKHPLILSSKHRVAEMIVRNAHENHFHAGPTLLISILKQSYSIIRCKNLVRRIIHGCVKCFRQKKITQEQLMGQLPPSRVNLIRPFLQVSVDYAGPYTVKTSKARKSTTYKAYLVVITCMATKAIHLELASDMTTDTFLAAFKRFVSRRGICADVFSDNGTNFVGAANELKHFQQLLSNEEAHIVNWATNNNTKWHFVPPASPHFNGLCEAAVKSVKFHLRRILNQSVPRYEELNTLLTQIEALLNSRPLCESLEEHIEALTPAHFIIGQPMTMMPEPDLTHLKVNRLSRWQMTQQMFQHFARRWQAEYLTTLNRMSKWRLKNDNLKVGATVLFKDDNSPPGQWPLGRIEEIHPGKDGIVRVVTIKTSKGSIKRPITKVCLLPLINSSDSSTGAACRSFDSSSSDEDTPTSAASTPDTVISISSSSSSSSSNVPDS